MIEFLSAHPLVAVALVFVALMGVARIVAVPFEAWAKVQIVRSRRHTDCPRCGGTGADPDTIDKLAARRRAP